MDSGENYQDEHESDDNFHPTIRILGEERTVHENLGIQRVKLRVQLLNPPEPLHMDVSRYNEILNSWLDRTFTALLESAKSKLSINPRDKVGLVFRKSDNDTFSLSFRRFDQYNAAIITSAISRILQSNAEYLFDELLQVEVTHIQPDVGYGKRRFLEGIPLKSFAEAHSRSMVLIEPSDGRESMCLAYALILGIVHAKRDKICYDRLTHKSNIEMFTQFALKLCEKANVDLSYGGGIEELLKFQQFLSNRYNIVVFKDRKGRSILFKGLKNNSIQKIYLLFEDEHYSLITNIHGAFSLNYFCDYCLSSAKNKLMHKDCPYTCYQCFSKPPHYEPSHKILFCETCNRMFYGDECFACHIKNKVCNTFRVCDKCLKSYRLKSKHDKHECDERYCSYCRSVKKTGHDCFIPKISINTPMQKPDSKFIFEPLFIFYDFETTQNQLLLGETNKFVHIVNLVVAQQACRLCIDTDENNRSFCRECKTTEHIFIGKSSLGDFMTYLTKIHSNYRKVICIAHNMKAFDGHFILKYMYENNSKWHLNQESIIANGTKIFRIKAGRYIFLDSVNYLCCPLSKLPGMFNIPEVKGWFPHFFNTFDNMNYIGAYPDKEYYSCDTMNKAERKIFLEWYQNKLNSNEIFNMKEQLIKYCQTDVDILRKACIQFRSMLLSETGVDPFDGPVTIASTCMRVFRAKYLKENTIASVPTNGYRRVDNQSIKATQWLHWLQYKNNIRIRMAENGREVWLPIHIKVDGFCARLNKVYEFYGCYYHRCKRCFPVQTVQFGIKRDVDNLRTRLIFEEGYEFEMIWECEFDQELKSNEEMRNYIKSLTHIKREKLDMRNSYFGGRTNATKLYHKCNEHEKIRYYDVCSLYPYVLKYCAMPVGVPNVLIGDDLIDRDVFNIEGIIYCKILPPKNLYHPVLPIKMHNKLLFMLCHACTLEKSQNKCQHSDSERSFDGTYVAHELRLAIENGYEVLEIYEAYEYKLVQFDKTNSVPGLFSEYVNFFLKMKTEASGFPDWVKTESDKDKYIEEYFNHEGIKLEKSNIKDNKGFRTLSKALLNYLYGKFGERYDKLRKMIVSERSKIVKMFTNPNIEVHSMFSLSSDTVLLTYRDRKEAIWNEGYSNIAIAAYVTAHARIKLYSYLNKLKEDVLYFDTDSVIFIDRENGPKIETGDHLGDMKDELVEGAFISEFVSGGPKNYAYKVMKQTGVEETVCKVKGIRLNYMNSSLINFNSIKQLLLMSVDEPNENKKIEIRNKIILREKNNVVYTTDRLYKYRINATKRRKCADFNTFPFGYC